MSEEEKIGPVDYTLLQTSIHSNHPCGSNSSETGCAISSITTSSVPDVNSQCLVTLCIKLPDGERIQHRFNYRKDQIKDVVHFAHMFYNHGDIDEMCLSDGNVPVNVYSDYFVTLDEAGLTHNSLLHYSYR